MKRLVHFGLALFLCLLCSQVAWAQRSDKLKKTVQSLIARAGIGSCAVSIVDLQSNERVDLRAALRSADPEAALAGALDTAMRIKPLRHHFDISAPGAAPAVARHMSTTGG